MTKRNDKRETMAFVLEMLAADYACPIEALTSEGTHLSIWEEREGRRRYPLQSRHLMILTTGAGVIASSHPDHVDWLGENAAGRDREEIFAATGIARLADYLDGGGQVLYGPNLAFVCSNSRFRRVEAAADVEIVTVERDTIQDLYAYKGFANALMYAESEERSDIVATVARQAGDIVGIAGASADTDQIWQIGVDIVGGSRGQGLGRALVSALTETILDRDRIPYYATSLANIRSRTIAAGLGFWPAWTEMYARDL